MTAQNQRSGESEWPISMARNAAVVALAAGSHESFARSSSNHTAAVFPLRAVDSVREDRRGCAASLRRAMARLSSSGSALAAAGPNVRWPAASSSSTSRSRSVAASGGFSSASCSSSASAASLSSETRAAFFERGGACVACVSASTRSARSVTVWIASCKVRAARIGTIARPTSATITGPMADSAMDCTTSAVAGCR
jgi:hypothetical protein